MSQIMFQTKVLGIPCIIYIDNIDYQSPDPDCDSSDIDFYGYTDYTYTINNRRNQRIKWLEDKLDLPENMAAKNALSWELKTAVDKYIYGRDLDSLL